MFEALVTKAAIARWLPPEGARAIVQKFEPRPGGVLQMTLVFDNTTKGKTTQNSDQVEGIFVDVVPRERIEQEFVFVSDDPKFAGTMLMTWRLEDDPEGTRVSVMATDVPEGIKPEDHRAGMASSLLNLARYVETDQG